MEYKVRATNNKKDEIGKLVMLDVLDEAETVVGKQVALIMDNYFTTCLHKHPDLKDRLCKISGDIHKLMIELLNRDSANE